MDFSTILLVALAALALAAGAWVVNGYLKGQSPTAALFGPKPERRLAVIEQAAVDSRRRLLLIRRDGVEHLIMIGGPVDVVIETSINDARRRIEPEPVVGAQPVFSRPPRAFGERAAE